MCVVYLMSTKKRSVSPNPYIICQEGALIRFQGFTHSGALDTFDVCQLWAGNVMRAPATTHAAIRPQVISHNNHNTEVIQWFCYPGLKHPI